MGDPTDDVLKRIDDVLERAFPEPPAETPDDEAPAERPWPVSEERQRQLERLGTPDNESW